MPAALDLTLANSHLLESIDARLSIFLPPFYLDNLMLGVMRELNGQLLSYMDDWDGLLMGFSPPRIVSSQALLCPWLPYMDIQVDCELLLFKPLPGDILVGRAHELSAGQLNLVVLGGVNAAIPLAELPPGYAFDHRNQLWVPDGDYSRAIMVGDIVACRALSAPMLDPQGPDLLFSLDASLVGPHTGLTPRQPRQQQEKRARLLAAAAAHQERKQLKQQEKLHKQEKKKKKEAKNVADKQAKQQQQQQEAEPMSNGTASAADVAALLAKSQVQQLSKAERKAMKHAHQERRQEQQQTQPALGPGQQQQQQQAKQPSKRKQLAEAEQPAAKKQKRSSKQQQQQQIPNSVVAAHQQSTQPGAANGGSSHHTKNKNKNSSKRTKD